MKRRQREAFMIKTSDGKPGKAWFRLAHKKRGRGGRRRLRLSRCAAKNVRAELGQDAEREDLRRKANRGFDLRCEGERTDYGASADRPTDGGKRL